MTRSEEIQTQTVNKLDGLKGKKLRNSDFFDGLSEFYDEMVGFDQALERRKSLLAGILSAGYKSAADLGCGTGMDSIALASAGLSVDAFDQSKGMLSMAQKNAAGRGLSIKFHNIPFDKIPAARFNGYDLVVSLGNSLANLRADHLGKTASIIGKMMNPGGTLLVQILNYQQILRKGERIINITEKGGSWFVRFYDFEKQNLTFNVLTFNKTNPSERNLYSSVLFPYTFPQLKKALSDAGFKKLKAYGNLKLEKFDANDSQDLVITAVR